MSNVYPEAFGGDRFIEAELRFIVDGWGVKTIVETGTHLGHSTKALAGMGPLVFTIENDLGFWRQAADLDKLSGVRRLLGDSGALLSQFKDEFSPPVLFYLDAHWGPHSPLLEELGAIAGMRGPVLIAIHDFFNPAHPAYGFDHWDIGEYRLELIEPSLDNIYSAGGWRCSYNQQAQGLKRGIIYIEPVD